jgi:hypothetical protein
MKCTVRSTVRTKTACTEEATTVDGLDRPVCTECAKEYNEVVELGQELEKRLAPELNLWAPLQKAIIPNLN